MSDKRPANHLPPGPLVGLCLVLAFSVGAIVYARLARVETVRVPPSPIVASADLKFHDAEDGSVQVINASDGRPVTTLAPGTNAFVRMVVRGLVRVRVRAGIGPEIPFRLEQAADRHIALADPATGRRIELTGFGDLNAAAFARLMPVDTGARS